MKHPNNIPKYDGTLKELAQDVENMSYDAVAEFLDHLAEALFKRASKDRNNSKHQLSENLGRASFNIDSAVIDMRKAWTICKPYMRQNNEEASKRTS